MRQEHHVGYEIKALANLLRRKVLETTTGSPDGDDFTEMQAKILGFLCHNRDQEVCQKDIEDCLLYTSGPADVRSCGTRGRAPDISST